MKLSTILKKVLKEIDRDSMYSSAAGTFTCLVIDSLTDAPEKDKERLTDEIERRLGHRNWELSQWLRSIPHVSAQLDKMTVRERWSAIQAHRIAWIESMIVEFKSIGD